MRSFVTSMMMLVFSSLVLSGCMGEGWTLGQGDVAKIKVGMGATQVATTIGKPSYINRGEGTSTGLEEWVYPTGTVLIYRLDVKHVILRKKGDPMPPKKKDAWDAAMKNAGVGESSDF